MLHITHIHNLSLKHWFLVMRAERAAAHLGKLKEALTPFQTFLRLFSYVLRPRRHFEF